MTQGVRGLRPLPGWRCGAARPPAVWWRRQNVGPLAARLSDEPLNSLNCRRILFGDFDGGLEATAVTQRD